MATFNTAFGSLPTPEKELFGNSATARKPKARGTGQGEQGIAPGSTMNFADLQKNGIARPAPPSAQVAAPPPMLSSLQEQLKEPVVPLASPQVSTAPVPMAAAAPTADAPTAAPVPTPVPTAVPTGATPPAVAPVGALPAAAAAPAAAGTNIRTENADGSFTVTKPDTPVVNAPKYDTDNLPPADAPNGSTFFNKSTGVTWTKRAGAWNIDATAATDRGGFPTGYQGLSDPALVGSGTNMGSGVDGFLSQYGIPKNETQWAALAAQSGMTVQELKDFVKNNPIRYDTQDNLARYAEDRAWRQANNLTGPMPSGFVYVSAAEGGPGIRRQTFAEAAKEAGGADRVYGGEALYNDPVNAARIVQNNLPAEWEQFFIGSLDAGDGGPSGGGGSSDGGNGSFVGGGGSVGNFTLGGDGRYSSQTGGGAPSSFYVSPTTTYAMPNYSNLLGSLGASLGTGTAQTTGGAAPTGGYAGSTQALSLRKQLEEQLGLLAAGSDTQRKAFDATRGARSAELTAQYGAERSKLEEDLAARGLSASTIGGGRYGDLAGQQARAMASFEADMLKQQSEAEARDRALYMSTMSDLAGMAGTQDLGAYEANLKAKQINSDIAFRAAELQQEAALKGRDLDLQSARDQATSQYQSGQLGLGYAEMRSREQLQREDQTFRAGESALERNIRLQLQGNEIRSQEEIAKLDRGLRDKIASGELTLNQGIALGNVAGRIWDGSLDLSYWDTAVISLGLDPKDFPRPPVNPNNKNSNTPPPNPDTSGNPPRQENPPPAATLQNYTPGTRFNIRGVIYTLDSSGRLIDPSGRVYNYSNAE